MMKVVRCSICLVHLRTLKSLKAHYMKMHPKLQIVNKMVQNEALGANFKAKKKTKPTQSMSEEKPKPSQHFIHENLHINYSGNTITIENESTQDKLVEITFSNNCEPELLQNVDVEGVESKLSSSEEPQKIDHKRNNKKAKKVHRVQIGITNKLANNAAKSLNDESGEFYECHCMSKPTSSNKASSDTESAGSECGKMTFDCTRCGNGYNNSRGLQQPEISPQVVCRICNRVFDFIGFKEHFQEHLIRIFVCHQCGFEFSLKEMLLEHLNYHQEQQVLNDILDMEETYGGFSNNLARSNNNNNNIPNIVSYLSYPYDHYYSRSCFTKIVCEMCRMEVFSYEYENHLKNIHCLQM